jgi:hypothetical protein
MQEGSEEERGLIEHARPSQNTEKHVYSVSDHLHKLPGPTQPKGHLSLNFWPQKIEN